LRYIAFQAWAAMVLDGGGNMDPNHGDRLCASTGLDPGRSVADLVESAGDAAVQHPAAGNRRW
jgi:hypothetical protein